MTEHGLDIRARYNRMSSWYEAFARFGTLGQMGRRLQQIYETPVEQRPLDLYVALTEVAR